MNREDFTEGSVHQIIFDYCNGAVWQPDEFYRQLFDYPTRRDLVDFIVEIQSKGFLKGYCHE